MYNMFELVDKVKGYHLWDLTTYKIIITRDTIST